MSISISLPMLPGVRFKWVEPRSACCLKGNEQRHPFMRPGSEANHVCAHLVPFSQTRKKNTIPLKRGRNEYWGKLEGDKIRQKSDMEI